MSEAVAPAPSLQARCERIEFLLLDVDGVLTDGGIIYADDGTEVKTFHVRDGSGLALWRKAGKRAGIITGRRSRIVEVRAAELGIDPVVQGAADKLAAFRQVLAQTGFRPEQVAYVGDDLPDVPVLRHAGLGAAVADACAEARAAAHLVTGRPGGRGAVREVIEVVLGCQGHWQRLVAGYRNESL
jgi:3-deoxy-D-manno-octulosonate 8-phosphate phosphatase (KDO 8-P phosphatase)